jgi:hypothetical protein
MAAMDERGDCLLSMSLFLYCSGLWIVFLRYDALCRLLLKPSSLVLRWLIRAYPAPPPSILLGEWVIDHAALMLLLSLSS